MDRVWSLLAARHVVEDHDDVLGVRVGWASLASSFHSAMTVSAHSHTCPPFVRARGGARICEQTAPVPLAWPRLYSCLLPRHVCQRRPGGPWLRGHGAGPRTPQGRTPCNKAADRVARNAVCRSAALVAPHRVRPRGLVGFIPGTPPCSRKGIEEATRRRYRGAREIWRAPPVACQAWACPASATATSRWETFC